MSHTCKLLMIFSLFCFWSFSPAHAAEKGPLSKWGDLRSVEEPMVDLKAGEGKKGVVLLFLSARCPCSHQHIAHLNELQKQFPDFHFIGIHSNQDEPEEEARAYFQKQKLGFPVIHDQDAVLADKWGALKTPHAFVLDPRENLLFHGGITNAVDIQYAKKFHLQKVLSEIQAGKEPSAKEVKTVGCYISRKKSS